MAQWARCGPANQARWEEIIQISDMSFSINIIHLGRALNLVAWALRKKRLLKRISSSKRAPMMNIDSENPNRLTRMRHTGAMVRWRRYCFRIIMVIRIINIIRMTSAHRWELVSNARKRIINNCIRCNQNRVKIHFKAQNKRKEL